jgi:hypothetical protein
MTRNLPPRRPARPAVPRLAPCSPPSRTLRAAHGGGLGGPRPSLTAAPRGAWKCSGRDEKTTLPPNQKTMIEGTGSRTTHALQKPDIFTRHRHEQCGRGVCF